MRTGAARGRGSQCRQPASSGGRQAAAASGGDSQAARVDVGQQVQGVGPLISAQGGGLLQQGGRRGGVQFGSRAMGRALGLPALPEHAGDAPRTSSSASSSARPTASQSCADTAS